MLVLKLDWRFFLGPSSFLNSCVWLVRDHMKTMPDIPDPISMPSGLGITSQIGQAALTCSGSLFYRSDRPWSGWAGSPPPKEPSREKDQNKVSMPIRVSHLWGI